MITLYENLRSIVYAPFYLADKRHFWSNQGLDIKKKIIEHDPQIIILHLENFQFDIILNNFKLKFSKVKTKSCYAESTWFKSFLL